MQANKLVGLAVLGATIVCGCTPDSLTKATVASVEQACLWINGQPYVYQIGEKEQAILRDEFETWQQEASGGFEYSFLDYEPLLSISGKLEDGTSYSVELAEEIIVVTEIDEKGKSSRYERLLSSADKRFCTFLLACMMDKKFPRVTK